VSRYDELVTRLNIGKTVSKRCIEALMICHPINKKRDNRKAVIIMARQHPG
jgi:cytosolic carboxypeptidase protein 2/3